MEAAALCTHILMTVFLLFAGPVQRCCYTHKLDAAFPRIEPDSLQFFEYDNISVSCEDLGCSPECRVMKKLDKDSTNTTQLWETSTKSFTLSPADADESGEYWCESKEGERSSSVNITITGFKNVILESPSGPVTEGDRVSLSCRKRRTSGLLADFYRDGVFAGTGFTGTLIIDSVSKSDEGIYKCGISGVGESAESWLAVRDAIFPHIIPSRLQFFEYESFSINCKGIFKDLNEWRVVRKTPQFNNFCDIKQKITGYCNITTVFSMDSGEYWCEAAGMKSNSVSIIVTDGSVILESPVHPVMEGDDVTLSCRNKTSSSTFTAHFYKDGSLMGSSSTGKMIIHRVSRSHDGLYRCRITGAGESKESQLVVRDGSVILDSPTRPVREGETVTLHCRNKASKLKAAAFYKDGRVLSNSSTGGMTIHSVSTSDEGLYKCSMPRVGQSPEAWLTVRARPTTSSPTESPESPETPSPVSSSHPSIFSVIFTVLCVDVLALVMGLLHCRKHKVSGEASVNTTVIYTVVTKHHEK